MKDPDKAGVFTCTNPNIPLGTSSILKRQERYQMTKSNQNVEDLQRNGQLNWDPQTEADVFPNPWVKRQDGIRPLRGHQEPLGFRVSEVSTPEIEMESLLKANPDHNSLVYNNNAGGGTEETTCRRKLPNDDITTITSPFFPMTVSDSKEAKSKEPTNLLEIIRLNFVKYCETTSLRGVPKVVKTNDVLLRRIWATFVLIFFAGCLTCLALIIKQFLDYDVIHQPRTVRYQPVQFPSFTVCNTHPLSQKGIEHIKKQKLMLPKKYTETIREKVVNTAKNLNHTKQRFEEEDKDAFSSIFMSKGYYENIPEHIKVEDLGHTIDQMILFCECTVEIDSFKKSLFCDHIGNWTRTYDPSFLNCYTYTANQQYTTTILTVRIMGYTNERSNLTTCPDCTFFPATQVSGLRVQLHNAGNYPEVQTEGLNLKPGSLTEIRFETKEWKMKEPPHGRCSKKVQTDYMHFNKQTFTYSYQACKKKKIQELIKTSCGCLDSTIPIPDDMNRTGVTYCGKIPLDQYSLDIDNAVMQNQSSPSMMKLATEFYKIPNPYLAKLPTFIKEDKFENFMKRIKCNLYVYKFVEQSNKNNGGQDSCFTPCLYYTYDTTISTTNWPSKGYILDMHNDMIEMKRRIDSVYGHNKTLRNSSYLDHIIEKLNVTYTPVQDALKENNTIKALKLLKSIDYVEDNFIEILINRGKSNFEILSIEEKETITITSLLSQVGGLLSIWVGLTFVCIVEIIEMVYNVLLMYRHR